MEQLPPQVFVRTGNKVNNKVQEMTVIVRAEALLEHLGAVIYRDDTDFRLTYCSVG